MKLAGDLVDSKRTTRSLEAYLDEQLIPAHPDWSELEVFVNALLAGKRP
jgi:hypothetical protein